ncbi:MAG: PIN domain-containing protein, partial [Acidimicrobiia bacterium]|nr:PIN domain-containing protein [Acidimicrobiia bacterium]
MALLGFLVDKSALARVAHPSVAPTLDALARFGLIATCPIIDLEVGFSARDLDDFDHLREERSHLRSVPLTPTIGADAHRIQRALAAVGHHRVPIADLLIAAASRDSGFPVLHYDKDFASIASVVDLDHEWIAP